MRWVNFYGVDAGSVNVCAGDVGNVFCRDREVFAFADGEARDGVAPCVVVTVPTLAWTRIKTPAGAGSLTTALVRVIWPSFVTRTW